LSFAHETYEEYLKHQLAISSTHEQYLDKDTQERAIEMLFGDILRDKSILDVGCGCAIGLAKLRSMKFKTLYGFDIDLKRVELCNMMGFETKHGDMANLPFPNGFVDFVFSSHSFEHNRDPVSALKELLRVGKEVIMIVPFPDFADKDQHPASGIMGTRIIEDGRLVNDLGVKFIKWLEDNGAEIGQDWMWPIGVEWVRQDEYWIRMKGLPS
jgi:SAM-dependent methyltransferase